MNRISAGGHLRSIYAANIKRMQYSKKIIISTYILGLGGEKTIFLRKVVGIH